MRIGFFTDTFLPQRNGVVVSLLSFGSELVKRGYEVHVFCPRSHLKEIQGMRVHSYPAVKFRPYPEFRIAIPQGRDRTPPLDLVHSHSPFTMGFFGNRVAKFQGIPRVATFHTLLSEYLGYVFKLGAPLMKVFTWQLCRGFFNRQKKVIAPTRALRWILRERGITKPITVIPTGVDTEFFKPIPKPVARRKLKLEDGKIYLSLGRLGHEKNVDVIIRAMKGVEGKLVVCGRGPAAKKLKALAKREGLKGKVLFRGFVPEKQKPHYYSAADALVIASTSETQAIVAVEAMACGTPVIGAKALAIPELVRDGWNGRLFEPGNQDQLGQILREFDPGENMRKNALRTSRSFSIKKCVARLEKFYRRLV
jgi:glycosyltransferase involved in cell wall biosynthesis